MTIDISNREAQYILLSLAEYKESLSHKTYFQCAPFRYRAACVNNALDSLSGKVSEAMRKAV